MLNSHLIASSSRTVRLCSPWGGRWIGHWRTTWPTVCSSAPHSQAAEEAILHLYKQEQKRSTPVRRRLSRTQALLGRLIPGGGCRCRGCKCGVLWGCPPTPHSIADPPSAPHACCCCQMNWWVVVRRVQMGVSIWGAVRLHSMDGWALSGADVQAPWHGVPETVRLDCDEAQQVGCLRGLEGLSAGVGRGQPVTVRKASLMAGSMRRVWALRHQTGAQSSIVECTSAKVPIRSVFAPAPQPEPANRLRSATRDVSFLRSDSRCRRYVSDLSNVAPRYLGSEQKGRISLLY